MVAAQEQGVEEQVEEEVTELVGQEMRRMKTVLGVARLTTRLESVLERTQSATGVELWGTLRRRVTAKRTAM